MKQKDHHCFDHWLLQATHFRSHWWFCFPLHFLASRFRIVQKCPKLTTCNGSVDCCDRCGRLFTGCECVFLFLVYETAWKNVIHIFLFPKLSYHLQLMHILSSVNFRVILWSLDTSSLIFAIVSGFLVVDSCLLPGPSSGSTPLFHESIKLFQTGVCS